MKAVALVMLALCSACSPVMVKHDPQPIDTALKDENRDWAEVFKHEIKVAVENEDEEAYHFFFQEYMRERIRQVREAKEKNP